MFFNMRAEKMNTKYGVLVILGGGLTNDHGKWRTTNFNEGDEFGITGDRIRIVAGAILFSHKLSDIIYVSCGRGQYAKYPEIPIVAEVMKKELIELGVPSNHIVMDDQSGNTHQQLKFIKSLTESKIIKKIGIISNEWHLPRIKAMLEYSPHLKGLSNCVELLAGEEIATQYDKSTWKDIIENARKSDGMKKRIALEQKGVQNIKEGRYKFS